MIKERLLNLPSEIERAKKVLLDKQNELLRVKSNIKNFELVEMANISNMADEKGKAIFSNETKRQAELQRIKETSEDFAELERVAKDLEVEVALLNIQLEKLLNEQSNLRAICRLEGAANE